MRTVARWLRRLADRLDPPDAVWNISGNAQTLWLLNEPGASWDFVTHKANDEKRVICSGFRPLGEWLPDATGDKPR